MGKVTFGRTRSSTSSSYQTGARTPSSSPPVCVVVTQAPLPPACTGPGSHALGSVLRADAQSRAPCGWLVTHLSRSDPGGSSGLPCWHCSWRRTPAVHGR